jgi:hypothetical protein
MNEAVGLYSLDVVDTVGVVVLDVCPDCPRLDDEDVGDVTSGANLTL